MTTDNTTTDPRTVRPTDYEAVPEDFDGTVDPEETFYDGKDDGHYDRKRIETPDDWEHIGDYVLELIASESAGVQINVWEEGESSLEHIWKPATIDGDDYHKAGEQTAFNRSVGCGIYEAVTDASDVSELMAAVTSTDMLDVAARAGIEL